MCICPERKGLLQGDLLTDLWTSQGLAFLGPHVHQSVWLSYVVVTSVPQIYVAYILPMLHFPHWSPEALLHIVFTGTQMMV